MADTAEPPQTQHEEKQCRICLQLDGEDPDLGRMIRPCLCKGSMSHVHVKCLQMWRTTSSSKAAFYACPQCGYHYHFARTRVVGIATNPIVVGVLSALVFTLIVLLASLITTSLLYEDSKDSYYYLTPWEIFRNLIRTTVRTLTDARFEQKLFASYNNSIKSPEPIGFFKRLFHRFLLGLPVVGAGSVIYTLLSLPIPFNWIRYRTRRTNRDSASDFATLIVVLMVLVGALRALWKVYQLTESVVQRLLLRAEEAIVEVG